MSASRASETEQDDHALPEMMEQIRLADRPVSARQAPPPRAARSIALPALPVELHAKIALYLTQQPPYEAQRDLHNYRLSSRIGYTATQARPVSDSLTFMRQVIPPVMALWPAPQAPLSSVQTQTCLELMDVVSPQKRQEIVTRVLARIRQDPEGASEDTVTPMAILANKIRLIPAEQHRLILAHIMHFNLIDRLDILQICSGQFTHLSPDAQQDLARSIHTLSPQNGAVILSQISPHFDLLPTEMRAEVLAQTIALPTPYDRQAQLGALVGAIPSLPHQDAEDLIHQLTHAPDEETAAVGLAASGTGLQHLSSNQQDALIKACLDIDSEWYFSVATQGLSRGFAHLSDTTRHALADEMLDLMASTPRLDALESLASQFTSLDPALRERCVQAALQTGCSTIGLYARHLHAMPQPLRDAVFDSLGHSPDGPYRHVIFMGLTASWPVLKTSQRQTMLQMLSNFPQPARDKAIMALRQAPEGLSHREEEHLSRIAGEDIYSLQPARHPDDRARQVNLALHDLSILATAPQTSLRPQARLLAKLASG